MKRTEFFESAYEVAQHYPNGVPSTVIAIVGEGTNVFVSSDNSEGDKTQQYFSADLTNDEIVEQQVETAYTAGTSYGYEQGEAAGYETGYTAGYETGYTAGIASVPVPTGTEILNNLSLFDVASYAYAQIDSEGIYPENIKSGITILGVTGSYEGSGFTPTGNIEITTTSQYDVTAYATAQVDSEFITSGNIKSGVTILGVQGSYTGLVPSGTAYINANTVTDVTTYAYAYCEASGGGGQASYSAPQIYEPNYWEMPLTVEILSYTAINGNLVGDDTPYSFNDEFYVWGEDTENGVSMLCSKNGAPFEALEFITSVATIPVQEGDILQFKVHKEALRAAPVAQGFTKLIIGSTDFSNTCHSMPFNMYGNLKSVMEEDITNGVFHQVDDSNYTFGVGQLGVGLTVINAYDLRLPIPTMTSNGDVVTSNKPSIYANLFEWCNYLINAPVLPSLDTLINENTDILGNNWFQAIFRNCKSLNSVTIPRYTLGLKGEADILYEAFDGVGNLSTVILMGVIGEEGVIPVEFTYDEDIVPSDFTVKIYSPDEDNTWKTVTDNSGNVTVWNDYYDYSENEVNIDFDIDHSGEFGTYEWQTQLDIYVAAKGIGYNNGYSEGYNAGYAEATGE